MNEQDEARRFLDRYTSPALPTDRDLYDWCHEIIGREFATDAGRALVRLARAILAPVATDGSDIRELDDTRVGLVEVLK